MAFHLAGVQHLANEHHASYYFAYWRSLMGKDDAVVIYPSGVQAEEIIILSHDHSSLAGGQRELFPVSGAKHLCLRSAQHIHPATPQPFDDSQWDLFV